MHVQDGDRVLVVNDITCGALRADAHAHMHMHICTCTYAHAHAEPACRRRWRRRWRQRRRQRRRRRLTGTSHSSVRTKRHTHAHKLFLSLALGHAAPVCNGVIHLHQCFVHAPDGPCWRPRAPRWLERWTGCTCTAKGREGSTGAASDIISAQDQG